jgi:hypothetical protein
MEHRPRRAAAAPLFQSAASMSTALCLQGHRLLPQRCVIGREAETMNKLACTSLHIFTHALSIPRIPVAIPSAGAAGSLQTAACALDHHCSIPLSGCEKGAYMAPLPAMLGRGWCLARRVRREPAAVIQPAAPAAQGPVCHPRHGPWNKLSTNPVTAAGRGCGRHRCRRLLLPRGQPQVLTAPEPPPWSAGPAASSWPRGTQQT